MVCILLTFTPLPRVRLKGLPTCQRMTSDAPSAARSSKSRAPWGRVDQWRVPTAAQRPRRSSHPSAWHSRAPASTTRTTDPGPRTRAPLPRRLRAPRSPMSRAQPIAQARARPAPRRAEAAGTLVRLSASARKTPRLVGSFCLSRSADLGRGRTCGNRAWGTGTSPCGPRTSRSRCGRWSR